MSSLIEKMTGITIQSSFFNHGSEMEFFPCHIKASSGFKNRVAILYGANGSGKSTIAGAFRDYGDGHTSSNVHISIFDKDGVRVPAPKSDNAKIHVFDESYIESNVRIQESGLDTIVLLGKQVDLEDEINRNEKAIDELTEEIRAQEELCKVFADSSNHASPYFWISEITKQLQRPKGWAEIQGININRNRRRSNVNESEIERIGKIEPAFEYDYLIQSFENLMDTYERTGSLINRLEPEIQTIILPNELEHTATKLLDMVVQPPELTERESELLRLFKHNVIRTAKGFLSISSHHICPNCLQEITEEYRSKTLASVERILNRDVELFKDDLQKLFLVPNDADYSIYGPIYNRYSDMISERIKRFNNAVSAHNATIQSKIDDPFTSLQYTVFNELLDATDNLNSLLSTLESERQEFNAVISDRLRTKRLLISYNDQIAHYEIQHLYTSLNTQRNTKTIEMEKLSKMRNHLNDLTREKERLEGERKNYLLATEEINRSLEYIFYSKAHMKIELAANNRYAIKTYGNRVEPQKISTGERNALALCYFFADIANGSDYETLYSEDMLLVIDDPVTSFDMENWIGILSFLRWKLHEVLRGNPTTKVLITTHDVSVMFDLIKCVTELSKWCSANGKHAEFNLFQLNNCNIEKFWTVKSWQ